MNRSTLIDVVHQTHERARSLRQEARESRWRAQAIRARARQLAGGHHEPEHTAETAPELPPIEPAINPVRHLLKASQRELLAELKQSLCDLETLRMTPPDDPAVRELTADIRKTIAQAAMDSPNSHRRRRTSPIGLHGHA